MPKTSFKPLKQIILGERSLDELLLELSASESAADKALVDDLIRHIGMTWGVSDTGGINTEGSYAQLVVEFYRALFVNVPEVMGRLNRVAAQLLPFQHRPTGEQQLIVDKDRLMHDGDELYRAMRAGKQAFSFTPVFGPRDPIHHTFGYTLFWRQECLYCLIHNQGFGSAEQQQDRLLWITAPDQLPETLDAFVRQLASVATPDPKHRLFRTQMGSGSLPSCWRAEAVTMPLMARSKQKSGYCARLAVDHMLSDQLLVDGDAEEKALEADVGFYIHKRLYATHLQHRRFSEVAHELSLQLLARLLKKVAIRSRFKVSDWSMLLEKIARKMATPFRGKVLNTKGNRKALRLCVDALNLDPVAIKLDRPQLYALMCGYAPAALGGNPLQAALNDLSELDWPSDAAIEHVCRLMSEHSIDARDQADKSYLMHAIDNRRETLALVLIELGACWHVPNRYQQTALQMAVKKNMPKVIHRILQQMAKRAPSVGLQKMLREAVQTAILQGLSECMEVFAEYSEEVLPIINSNSDTVIHRRSAESLKSAIEIMTPKAVNQINRQQLSALHVACIAGDLAKVKLLLAYGADTNQRNATKQTALHCALKHGHEAVALTLMQHMSAVYPNRTDAAGMSLFDYALKSRLINCVDWLYGKGANLYRSFDQFDNAMAWVQFHCERDPSDPQWQRLQQSLQTWHDRDRRVIAAIGTDDFSVPEGFCLNRAVNAGGDTVLHLAAQSGHQPSYDYLVARGADITRCNREGMTAERVMRSACMARSAGFAPIVTGCII